MNENQGLKISDAVWANVIQFVQLAMLTGTDVSDYLRLIKVKEENNEYVLADGQKELFTRQIEELVALIPTVNTDV